MTATPPGSMIPAHAWGRSLRPTLWPYRLRRILRRSTSGASAIFNQDEIFGEHHAEYLSQPPLSPGLRNEKPGTVNRFSMAFWLHEYLGGTISGLGGFSQGVGGMVDHVHLLIGLKATHCLADVLRELKKASSVWVHEDVGMSAFTWQEGYAAFTVSVTAREAIRKYIADQEEHHRTKSCREELIAMLKKSECEYDPRYLD